MFTERFGARSGGQHPGLGAVECDDLAHSGFTDGDGSRLVQHDVVDVGENLEGVT